MSTALVVGGTGPTGPHIVDGLLSRGYDVTIFHGGFHEVKFSQDVEHIHSAPHFLETFERAVTGRKWDLAVVTYGRLRVAVEALKRRTARLIAVGGATGGIAAPDDPRWGPLGPPTIASPDRGLLENNITVNKLRYRIAEAENALFMAGRDGHYQVTYLAYPILYGPRQPGPNDWSIIKRILDGRRKLVIADGGIKLESRAYAENAAHGVLTVVDNSEISSGQKYMVTDQDILPLRKRIEFYAAYFGHEWDIVDMPFDWAVPAHPLWRFQRESSLVDDAKIRQELGYRDLVSTDEALRRTAEWLVQNPIMADSAEEHQVGDPFDYQREDSLVVAWQECSGAMRARDWRIAPPGHMYRHPTTPNEDWRRG